MCVDVWSSNFRKFSIFRWVVKKGEKIGRKSGDNRMFPYIIALLLILINVLANADYVIEDTFEGEAYMIYGPPTIPKQFSTTLQTVAHQSDKVNNTHANDQKQTRLTQNIPQK